MHNMSCVFVPCRNPVLAGRTKCNFHRHRTPCHAHGCTNQAYSRGLCVRHGARKTCLVHNCSQHRRKGGYCVRHRKAQHASDGHEFDLQSHQHAPPATEHSNAAFEPLTFSPEPHCPPFLDIRAWKELWVLLEDGDSGSVFV